MPSDGRRDNRSSGRGPKGGPSGSSRTGGGRPPRKGGKPSGKGAGPDKGAKRSGKGRPTGRDDRGDRRDRSAGPERRDDERERRPGPDLAGPAKWGRIARGGAGRMESPAIGTEAMDDIRPPRKRPPKPPVDVDGESGDGEGHEGGPPAEPVVEKKPLPKKERDLPGAEDLQRHAAKAVRRSRGPAARERKPLGARPQRVQDPAVVLDRLVGKDRAKKLLRRLNDAGRAFQTERFDDARAALRPVLAEAPELAEARELYGLSLYRLGRWKAAIDELEAFRELTHSTEQHPVLMDCHRAKGRWADVEALWEELGEASPAGDLVTEGRIVLAGAQADQGDIDKAIRTLQAGWKLPKRPQDHHLRRAYALADLYDRAGKAARARELFKWIAGHDPRFADVKTRVKTLS
ncbi:MAG: tetratricopeptide repeat protein [Acidimicrobiales bacterium]|nr:tetratricopeptide repeat protein [Acidimicrobiales bacterium]